MGALPQRCRMGAPGATRSDHKDKIIVGVSACASVAMQQRSHRGAPRCAVAPTQGGRGVVAKA
eukprot:scaffold97377_cov33-Tisochrysis_lutea.AAC.1